MHDIMRTLTKLLTRDNVTCYVIMQIWSFITRLPLMPAGEFIFRQIENRDINMIILVYTINTTVGYFKAFHSVHI